MDKTIERTKKKEEGGRKHYPLIFSLLLLLCLLLVIFNLLYGAVDFSLGELWQLIFGGHQLSQLEANLLLQIRLPRILAALLYGAALSCSGYLLQSFFHNPIVGPSVLGITSGAQLAVGLVILSDAFASRSHSLYTVFLAAFLGSLLTMLLVLALAGRVRQVSTLVVIGIMIGYLTSAVTAFLSNFSSQYRVMSLTLWGIGSFSGVNWEMLKFSLLILPILLACFLLAKPLEAYLLGENYALSLGVNVRLFRLLLILFSSLLTAVVTAFAGPISFVGIAVPHLARLLLRTSRPRLMLPGVILLGGIFCLFCDFLARTLFAPVELNISILTSLVGAPVVIWLMMRGKA